ncbi:hypothetical protein CWI84_05635 [Idiomarina tyrosinivorans]|uniref:Uncharacterized protein n=1 Tax=Idiomarina tyrosinivorans TaxID=1445662 RepID=A0A432ZRM2_9GAMM|nr:PH domain-containing protein [Idiomarina tyrosinivorans]RUO80539.1 hypothetical protein CWI84_05635 [Idiomarina tyrosinivorans]
MLMRYQGVIKTIPLCTNLLAACLVALLILTPPTSVSGWIFSALFCSAFIVIAGWSSAEVYRSRIGISDRGLQIRKGWSRTHRYRWDQVDHLQYIGWLQSFRIHFSDGKNITVPILMSDLKGLLEAVAIHLKRPQYINALDDFAASFGGK